MARFLDGIKDKAVDKVEDEGLDVAGKGAQKAFDETMSVAKDESRKVSVTFTNKTGYTWMNPRIFLDYGVAEEILPLEIEDDQDLTFDMHKKKWTLTGIEGAITYEWEAEGKMYRLALMFKSPTMSGNCWNAIIYVDEPASANKELFRTLCQRDPIKADGNYTDKVFGDFTLKTAMTTSGTAKMKVIVTKN